MPPPADERDPASTHHSWDAYQPQAPRWSTILTTLALGISTLLLAGALVLLVWRFFMG